MDYNKKSLEMHRALKGKLGVVSRVKVTSKEDLSLAYTPGVAEPCLVIEKDIEESYNLTNRGNTVAVISDGSAVLGLGNIGPEASMPVMEGKCVLFKEFGDVDAIPLCIRSNDVEEIISTIKLLLGSFGGVNLEDISAPRCFEIERRLKEISDIPIFHDDQHGTAIVTLAGLINALKIVKKDFKDIKIVINGAGAAGDSIARLLLKCGSKDIIVLNTKGTLYKDKAGLDPARLELAAITNPNMVKGDLKDAVIDADVFIGVSGPNCLTEDMVKTMAKDSIVFALSNPVPEIMPDLAKKAGVKVIGTGRSDFPNQVNNVLAFPFIFRGALDAKATTINEEMKIAASYAIASLITEEELNCDYVIPLPFDKRLKECVSEAVKKAAIETGVIRK